MSSIARLPRLGNAKRPLPRQKQVFNNGNE